LGTTQRTRVAASHGVRQKLFFGKEEAAMSQKPCPNATARFLKKATVCPVCRNNLRPPSFGSKIRGLRLGNSAHRGLGTDCSAVYADQRDGSADPEMDGAKLDGHVLSFDIFNVGTDDRPADKQVDTVTQYEKASQNRSVQPRLFVCHATKRFVCTGEGTDERQLYTFNTFDLKQQVKVFSEIKAGEPISLFGKLNDNNVCSKDRPGPEAYKCNLGYSDKYGPKVLSVDIKKSMLQPFDG
jgi:hypothetical protein